MGLASHANEIDAPLSGRIAQGVHIFPVRVHWEDTDAGGIVYHASYLRFIERGRSEMLRLLGLDQTILRAQHGLNYVVKHLEIDYRIPAVFDMALKVATKVTRLGGASLDLHQTVYHDMTELTVARVLCVGISPSGKPLRAPDTVRAAFEPMLK
ncbi:UNVERIFIED_CONTAM: hypothetical protein GTU68_035452 [Idotea baltica]|nr:hypothetical protein [Idotea baltica]